MANPSAPLTLVLEPSPDEATRRTIDAGLDAYNETFAPGENLTPLWIIGRNEAGLVQAGLRGVSFFDWLFVIWLWVDEPHRRRGVGSELLSQAEEIARKRNCSGVYLDTFSFQAPKFYEKHGYREFGRLADCPPGHARIWLSKRL